MSYRHFGFSEIEKEVQRMVRWERFKRGVINALAVFGFAVLIGAFVWTMLR